MLYVDEVDIHLNPKIGLDWMLRGQQKEAPTPGQNEKRYLAGALDVRTGKLTWVEGPRKTSLLFLQLLYRLVTRTYRSARVIHVILDNYGIHDSLQVRLALATVKGRVKFHFLPPYCPDHNRIERGLAGPARQRHAEPPVPDHGTTHGTSQDLPQGPEQARAPLLPSGQGRLKVSRNHER